MSNLARKYSEQKEYERAGELELKALDLSKKCWGQNIQIHCAAWKILKLHIDVEENMERLRSWG